MSERNGSAISTLGLLVPSMFLIYPWDYRFETQNEGLCPNGKIQSKKNKNKNSQLIFAI